MNLVGHRVLVALSAVIAVGLPMAAVAPAAIAQDDAVAQSDAVVIDFSDDTPGGPPAGWSALWRESDYVVADDPRRLVHVAATSGRQGHSPDTVGELAGDVEVTALVRTPTGVQGGTRTVLYVHAGGEAGAENGYYVDFRWTASEGPFYRINRYNNGSFATLQRGPTLDDPPHDGAWYQLVLQRDGAALRFKVWPYGADEPAGWMIETTDSTHDGGRVAVGHTTGGNTITEWAHLAVGEPEATPRAPAGLIPAPVMPGAPEAEAVTLDRYLSVRWDAVDGADWYEVERDGQLVASPWTLTAYADPLLAADQQAEYRVRGVSAVLGAGPWSAARDGTAPAVAFPELLTPFEASGGQISSLDAELAFLADIDAASQRVAIDEVGTTVQGRPIHLVRVGYPIAPDEAEIRQRPTFFANCTVHGNEWTPRESCLRLIRDLALTDDPAVTSVLEEHAVIVIPTANPDGRAAGTRENADGIDVNRDYLTLETPEAQAIVDVVNTYQPSVVVDGHNCCDHSVVAMWSQNLNVHPELRGAGQGLVVDAMLGTAAGHGFTHTTSPLGTLGNPGIARNYTGLRHAVGILNEVRSGAMAGRLEEAAGYPAAANNRRLRAVAAFDMALDAAFWHAVDNADEIEAAVARSVADAEANGDPAYFGGDETTEPGPGAVIDPPTCGYLLSGAMHDHDRVAELLDRHTIDRHEVGGGVRFVPVGQPSGRLVPLLLDHRSPWNMADTQVLDDRRATVVIGEIDTEVTNHVLDGGCTIADRIHAASWSGTGEFVRHVNAVVDTLVGTATITAREAAAIRAAAARSGAEPLVPPVPPEPTGPGQHATDFSEDAVGQPPAGWSALWRSGDWTVEADPSRLRTAVHEPGRRALTWDLVGDSGLVHGDVEVAGTVRVAAPMPSTRFQLVMHAAGTEGAESAYYLDVQGTNLRVNRYQGGQFSTVSSGALPFTFAADTWYHVVLQRDGTALRAKIWPDGADEPADWLVTTQDPNFDSGRVGVAHFTEGAVNDWAWFSVGTGGEPAPRAPSGIPG